MAAFSRGLRAFPRSDFTCPRCLAFSTTATVNSGHNRWSKIRHNKGAKDLTKNTQRSNFAHEIALVTKLHGGDPAYNPRLANVLASAKKAGIPKAAMEAAIARGLGKSTTGAALENMIFEAIMPPSVAMIVDVATDNRSRANQDVKFAIKYHGGIASPTSYLFEKKGRVVLENDERKLGMGDVMDEAIEAGAQDVELDEDENIVIWTEPTETMSATAALQEKLGLKAQSSDIIWDANDDTKVPIPSDEAAKSLSKFIETLRENPNVQGVYANVERGTISDEAWEDLQSLLDA